MKLSGGTLCTFNCDHIQCNGYTSSLKKKNTLSLLLYYRCALFFPFVSSTSLPPLLPGLTHYFLCPGVIHFYTNKSLGRPHALTHDVIIRWPPQRWLPQTANPCGEACGSPGSARRGGGWSLHLCCLAQRRQV